MTWEETIIAIRQKPKYDDLVKDAYFDQNLELNINRFKNSDEFQETLKYLKAYPPPLKILDVGSGNGITAVSFALMGYEVHAVEPDPSKTVGAGAIRILKDQLNLDRLFIYESLAEDISFESDSFDIVYVRQAMHHAKDLDTFVAECLRVLKPGGLLLTIRDHVVYNTDDKNWFFQMHPLHKFYGGENAYSSDQYRSAFAKANGKVLQELKYYDSVINYAPLSTLDIQKQRNAELRIYKQELFKKIGYLAYMPGLLKAYLSYRGISRVQLLDETKVPGRMYSYIVSKS